MSDAIIRNFVGTSPPEEKTRQQIQNLKIEMIGEKKQCFNNMQMAKNLSGAFPSRSTLLIYSFGTAEKVLPSGLHTFLARRKSSIMLACAFCVKHSSTLLS